MDRRGFLGRMVMGAAAVLGASVVAPQAEAAEASQREADAYNRGLDVATARAESRVALGLPVALGALTFEAMQDDCAARGCSLESEYSPWAHKVVTTHTHWRGTAGAAYPFRGHLADMSALDAWRRSLNETG